jgi:hypothetical protein
MSSKDPQQKLFKRRGHHIIFEDYIIPAAFLEDLATRKYGLQAGFTKKMGKVIHVVIVLKNKPTFDSYEAISGYFEFGCHDPYSVSKITSSKTHFTAMLSDVCERLGGQPEHSFNFSERVKKPRLFIMRKIRLGLTLNGLRDMLFSQIPEELFAELLRNYEEYREFIGRFSTIKLIQS